MNGFCMPPRLSASGSSRCGIPREILIGNNLSPLLAEGLKAAGHDAAHLQDLACRRNQIQSSSPAPGLMSGSWYRLIRTLAACSPVPGRPARQSC